MPLRCSFVVPAWNEAPWLPRLLRALRAWPRLHEIIVADNDSADATTEIANAFGCRVIPGGRPAIARNRGAAEAAGELIVFVDADAVPPREALDRILKVFAERPAVIGLHFPLRPLTVNPLVRLCYATMDGYIHLLSKMGCTQGVGTCIAVRADAYRRVGGFREDIAVGEDADFLRRLSDVGTVLYDRSVVIYTSPRRLLVERGSFVAKTVMWSTLRLCRLSVSGVDYRWAVFPPELAKTEALLSPQFDGEIHDGS